MKKILVVDDDPSILEVIQMVLEQEGFKIIGSLSAESLCARAAIYNPDVILLDIRLSGYNGAQLAQCLRSHEKTKHIPTILISANYKGREISKKVGANDFIEKPFEVETLTQTVRKYAFVD